MIPNLDPFDLSGLADLHRDDNDAPATGVLGEPPPFPYVGMALSLGAFADYLSRYDFGTIPPDGICLHHTAIPDASWAPNPASKAPWDAGERGKSEEQIRLKRLRQIGNIKAYYNNTLRWGAGPHLFIDDRYIYLMSPMREPAIHARWANSWRDAHGRLHYPIAIEVIGDYTRRPWPPAVAALVAGAVQALQKRLGTFTLRYLYPTLASKPGMIGVGNAARCAHPERLKHGGISSHRDYNKPSCPGDAITEAYYMSVLTGASGTPPARPPAIDEHAELLGPPRCTLPQIHAYFRPQVRRGYTERDIHEKIIPGYWSLCVAVGIDPLLVLAQLVKETSEQWPKLGEGAYYPLCSAWSQRPNRNPAGIGVNGRWSASPKPGYGWNPDRRRYEQGVMFKDWLADAIPAHVGRLLAYAIPIGRERPDQAALIHKALGYRSLPDTMRGSAPTLRPLGKAHNPTGQGWASPGTDYGEKIAEIARAIASRQA